jgi:hypothetical protein
VAAVPAGTGPPVILAPRRATRTIGRDFDGDGIADSRVMITEIFDAAGTLVETIREEDFDADGIVDTRKVVTFDERQDPAY